LSKAFNYLYRQHTNLVFHKHLLISKNLTTTINSSAKSATRSVRMGDSSMTRRKFLQGSTLVGASLATHPLLPAHAQTDPPEKQPPLTSRINNLTLKINGHTQQLGVDVRATLLDTLREQLGLTGSKLGCNHGQCGACSVLIDGERRLACLTLAVQVDGSEVTTVEGLAELAKREGIASEDGLHPVQQAFIEHDAFQCGYCTPGQLISAVACINEGHANSEAEVCEYMSGNLCRCAAYPNITAAVLAAHETLGTDIEGGGARQDYHLGLLEDSAES
jgi:xanthine dehydrogenase YagT iron-sulfur-binding subunit